MKIKNFIEGRNVSYDTVRKYIVNHPDLFKGHIGRNKNIVLDETAIGLLEEKYPFPEPVQVIQDTSARDRLYALQEKYAAALEKITALTEQNSQVLVIQSKQRFLEHEVETLQKEKEVNAAEYDRVRETYKQLYEVHVAERKDLERLKRELDAEKNKSWWDKLRGR